MFKSRVFSLFVYLLAASLLITLPAAAQQTLGGIVGSLTDPTGSVLSGVAVTLKGDQNGLARTATTNSDGSYTFVNLPIGTYTLSYTLTGFQAAKYPAIQPTKNDGTHPIYGASEDPVGSFFIPIALYYTFYSFSCNTFGVILHFDENEFTVATILFVKIKYGMSCSTASCKTVEDYGV